MRDVVKILVVLGALSMMLLPLGGCGPKAATIDEHLQKTEAAVAAAQKMGLKGWLIVDAPLEAGVRTQTTFGNGGKVFGLFMVDPEGVANTFPNAMAEKSVSEPPDPANQSALANGDTEAILQRMLTAEAAAEDAAARAAEDSKDAMNSADAAQAAASAVSKTP